MNVRIWLFRWFSSSYPRKRSSLFGSRRWTAGDPEFSDAPITLQVGEREYRTRASTLTGGSAYFASMLSGRWLGAPVSVERSTFVDADPDLFQHVLQYLRRGVFPIFWKRNGGFDYALYTSLLQEARYFGVEKLQTSTAEEKYLRRSTWVQWQ